MLLMNEVRVKKCMCTSVNDRTKLKCISRESSPGHIDGNDVFYHQTTDAADWIDSEACDTELLKKLAIQIDAGNQSISGETNYHVRGGVTFKWGGTTVDVAEHGLVSGNQVRGICDFLRFLCF